MSLDAIKKISQAEEEAAAVRSRAETEAGRMVSDARRESGVALDAAVNRADGELAEFARKMDDCAVGFARDLAEKTENKKAAMRARAESRMETAVQKITERIVNG